MAIYTYQNPLYVVPWDGSVILWKIYKSIKRLLTVKGSPSSTTSELEVNPDFTPAEKTAVDLVMADVNVGQAATVDGVIWKALLDAVLAWLQEMKLG